jgi:hypothetical protein
MNISRKGAFAAGVVVTLVLGSGTAVAANGKPVLLGRSNSSTTPTTVTNTKGSALALKSKTTVPPLTVNSSKKVTRLNADLLDGLSSASFLRANGKAVDADKLDGVNSTAFALAGGQVGTIATYGYITATAFCPAGTKLTGGGGLSVGGDMGMSAPDSEYYDAWTVIGNGDVYALAQCWNPRGKVAGAMSTKDLGRLAARVEQEARDSASR